MVVVGNCDCCPVSLLNICFQMFNCKPILMPSVIIHHISFSSNVHFWMPGEFTLQLRCSLVRIIVNPNWVNDLIWACQWWIQLITNFFEEASVLTDSSIFAESDSTPSIVDNHLQEICKAVLCWPILNVMNISFSCDIVVQFECPICWRYIRDLFALCWCLSGWLSTRCQNPDSFDMWTRRTMRWLELVIEFLKVGVCTCLDSDCTPTILMDHCQ